VAEDLLNGARDDAALVGRVEALHRVRLARARLAVREDGRVVALERALDDGLGGGLVDLLLVAVLVVDVVEGEGVREVGPARRPPVLLHGGEVLADDDAVLILDLDGVLEGPALELAGERGAAGEGGGG
jgi:hypothetical protein